MTAAKSPLPLPLSPSLPPSSLIRVPASVFSCRFPSPAHTHIGFNQREGCPARLSLRIRLARHFLAPPARRCPLPPPPLRPPPNQDPQHPPPLQPTFSFAFHHRHRFAPPPPSTNHPPRRSSAASSRPQARSLTAVKSRPVRPPPRRAGPQLHGNLKPSNCLLASVPPGAAGGPTVRLTGFEPPPLPRMDVTCAET